MCLSGKVKWFFVLIVSTFSFEDAFSQVLKGCRSGGMIYRNAPAGAYGWTSPLSETCPANATTITQYTRFVQNTTGSSSCPIGLLNLGGTGVSVDYRLLNCPIDGWIAFLLIPAAFAGILMIRRSQTV